MAKMNKEEFIKYTSEELGINLSNDQINKLDFYCQFLIKTNENVNLTAIKTENEIYLKHFFDSLTITKTIDLSKVSTLIDIGTGAGFPGMVLKIVFPHLKLTLLDSNNKKINFLKELSEKLEISDINFYNGRAEEFVKNNRESFDMVTARAVSNLSLLSELCLPLTKVNGYFVPMKGANNEEIDDAMYAIELLGGKVEKIDNFKLPIEESVRNIIAIKKEKTTPAKYPRRYEKILKNPLKKNVK